MRNYAKVGGKKSAHGQGNGKRPAYRTPSSFKNKVLSVVTSIPRGKTMTYGEVAKKAGNAKAYRAVGSIMRKNCDPKVPCHRVIKSSGELGNYNNGGTQRKREILIEEGAVK